MNKIKLFIENFLVYGLGGIISKLIPLIMVPIVTGIMPSSEYFGISDLSNTIINFCGALASMGMYDAMYRLFFEKDDKEYKKAVCSTALGFTFISSLIVFFIMLIFKNFIAQCFFSNKQYAYVVYISAIATLVGATNSMIAAPTRMQNKRKVFLVTNTIGSLSSYAIAIPLLLAGYYVIALPLAAVLSGIALEIAFGIMNHSWFKYKYFNRNILKQLLLIGVPLLPNFLIYWLFNSCDKIMITNILGIGEAGIYSVGSKLGNCSQLIYTAFAGGWQYFAFSTMKEENQVKSNSMVFEYLGVISFITSCFVTASSYFLFSLLFTEQYLSGYIVAPYLFIAPLLQMLFQVACNQFIVIKKTWPNMFILSCGAVVNIVMNYFLIPIMGIEGASISTLVGYVVSDIICVIVLIKMGLMQISGRFIVSFVLMTVYLIIWRVLFSDKTIIGLFFATLTTILTVMLYRKDLIDLLTMIKRRKGNNETNNLYSGKE